MGEHTRGQGADRPLREVVGDGDDGDSDRDEDCAAFFKALAVRLWRSPSFLPFLSSILVFDERRSGRCGTRVSVEEAEESGDGDRDVEADGLRMHGFSSLVCGVFWWLVVEALWFQFWPDSIPCLGDSFWFSLGLVLFGGFVLSTGLGFGRGG
ncbi:hypothetical protein SUGI_0648530 [Cryptomeria japonica]|nr:hypothetical protein SUGI_0648530 [Cryptomeria japonica]